MASVKSWRWIAIGLIVLVAAPVVYVAHRRLQFDRAIAASKKDEHLWDAIFQSRFTRPVLHLSARPCNAAKQQDALLDKLRLGTLSVEEVNERLGQLETPLPSDLQPLLRTNAVLLDRLRASAQCSWSWSADPNLRRRRGLDDHLLLDLVGRKLMLARASSPGECLNLAAHSYRIAQDRAAGGGMVGAMTLLPAARLLATTAVRCGANASASERMLARALFDKLRHSRLHVGTIFLDEVFAYYDFLQYESLSGKGIFFPSDASEMESWRTADDSGQLAAELAGTVPLWKSLDRIDSRDSLKRVCDNNAVIYDRATAVGGRPIFDWCDYAKVMLETTISLRVATLAVMAVDADTWPTINLTSDLLDPYSDAPLVAREDGKMRWVWSVGENGKDDRAASGSDDIVWRFNLATEQ